MLNEIGNIIGSNGGPPRKNHPLCHETIRWKSDVPLTEGQLRSKRDEFWDTAPAFDGRKEIWDALRAATVAAEALDFQLSQAILDGANISVPNGFVFPPTNIIPHFFSPFFWISYSLKRKNNFCFQLFDRML